MQIPPPRKPSYRAAFYADWRWWMSLEKPATVVADPVESAKRNELTAGRARSSQRVRGAERLYALDDLLEGNIPACAGSSRSARHQCGGRRDHPRACGEQELPFAALVLLTGSSPRVRGTANGRDQAEAMPGIIPARAGSRASGSRSRRSSSDHPRVCGEQWLCTRSLWSTSGSSPRMRGAADAQLVVDELVGIIPACAGSSSRSRPRGTGSWDHPRACGEQALRFFTTLISSGSSPRMRGAARVLVLLVRRDGIIPTYAGSSGSASTTASRTRDHPRACGEQSYS